MDDRLGRVGGVRDFWRLVLAIVVAGMILLVIGTAVSVVAARVFFGSDVRIETGEVTTIRTR